MFKRKYYISTFLIGRDKKIQNHLKVCWLTKKQLNDLKEEMLKNCKKYCMKCVIYNSNCSVDSYFDFIRYAVFNIHN